MRDITPINHGPPDLHNEYTLPCVDGSRLDASIGYTARRALPTLAGDVTVLTPRAAVAVLRAGYRPMVHPSADTLTRA